ncbi:cysteine--tRNA ligase [Massilia sp. W12]|uniref:cysteine--tRNA ligase n=1 Tax=Massilia sp. W12 TaxID=3126507 RepID=UPI0030D12C20
MSSLKIYNSLSREKEVFVPLNPGQVGMYVCGMTIYDYCHVGHARMLMAFDIVHRWLKQSGYAVRYVRNITDIDDKIIRRAVENNEPIAHLTERFIRLMDEDIEKLNILPASDNPRATQFLPQMLSIIQTLEQKGLAYKSANGDVNFAVRKLEGYGKLSRRNLDDMRAGERVEVDGAKQDPLDFVLWKASKPEEPADVKYASPYGSGRPGWHIECSAMACSLLGEPFDIHGGGLDLVFPHHENEIAQSEGASGGQMARFWLHNGFLEVDGEKMSKSLGNFFTIRDVLKEYDAEVLRFFMLRTHYRSPLNYSDHHLDDAKQALTRLYTALKDCPSDGSGWDWDEEYAARYRDAMDDDFNTPLAMAALFELAGKLNRERDPRLASQLKGLGAVLGILQRDPQEFLQAQVKTLDAAWIEAQIEARSQAKAAKQFAEADRIRAELLEKGVVLEDKPGGRTEWRAA